MTTKNENEIERALTILARNPRIYPHDADRVMDLIARGDTRGALDEALTSAASPRTIAQYNADIGEERQRVALDSWDR